MTLLILFVLLAIGVSFLCSIMEAVLLSITPSFVAMKEQQKPKLGKRLRKLKEDVDRPLAAILTLNTIAHTVGAAGAGAQAAIVFGDASVGIFSAVLTLLILVLSEIIPKTLGARYWRPLAGPVARLLQPMIILLLPLVILSQWITRLLSREDEEASVSREEIQAMADVGHEEGVVEETESRILRNLFRLKALRVRDIMTPRTVAVAFPEDMTVAEMLSEKPELRFSRIPVYSETIDKVTGFVLKDDILLKAAQDQHQMPLKELKRELLMVPENLSLRELFERLLGHNRHIALVVDEFGGTAGIVTLEDVVETLLGLEIVDEADTEQDLQALARQQWKRRAKRLDLIPEREDSDGSQKDDIVHYGITGGVAPASDR